MIENLIQVQHENGSCAVFQISEDSKVDYSIGECCFDRLKETSTDHGAGCKHQRGAPQGLREGSMLHRASFRFTLGQYELEILD